MSCARCKHDESEHGQHGCWREQDGVFCACIGFVPEPEPRKQFAYYVFVLEPTTEPCSECGKSGSPQYTSRDKNGKVKKRVCSVSCGQDFELRAFGLAEQKRFRRAARRRAARRKRKHVVSTS